MKKLTVIIFVVLFTFVSCLSLEVWLQKTEFSTNNKNLAKINIVIDAGHGGRDAGTIAADGTNEKDINLSIALSLYDFLSVCGITTNMTRNEDKLLYDANDDRSRSDLYNRMDYINSIENSVLVSIHQNHFEDTSEWGMQVWYSANTEESEYLADTILQFDKQFIQKDNERLNKVSDSSYYLLYKATVPSVMVECGFMSNVNENNLLKDTNYQNKISCCIALGINDYIAKET